MDAATAQTHLDAWLAADLAIATGKSYTIGNRQLTRADVQEVRDQIGYWQRALNTVNAGSNSDVQNAGVRVAKWD